MSAGITGWAVRTLRVAGTLGRGKRRNLECACEPVERRLLLSTATFNSPTSLTVTGARAPIVAGRFHGTDNPNDMAVATATSVQILDGSSNGTFTLGQSIALPANPAAINPFQEGDFSGNGTLDITLDSHNSGTGDGVITYETNDGSANFTAGQTTSITDGGAGFTPIAISMATAKAIWRSSASPERAASLYWLY
jgi:hypothetical protein